MRKTQKIVKIRKFTNFWQKLTTGTECTTSPRKLQLLRQHGDWGVCAFMRYSVLKQSNVGKSNFRCVSTENLKQALYLFKGQATCLRYQLR